MRILWTARRLTAAIGGNLFLALLRHARAPGTDDPPAFASKTARHSGTCPKPGGSKPAQSGRNRPVGCTGFESIILGATTIGMLKQRGDLGIGTFNALDGEMIMLEGKVYRFGSDGSVTEMNDRALTPFAAVTFFEPDFTQALTPMTTFGNFQAQADKMLPTMNLPYAVRIDGLFRAVKTRAPRRQARPYPRLIDALANQPEFDYHDVHGTLVGFRLPQYFNGVIVAGWHLHFISTDHSKGGHVLSFTVLQATFAYDVSPNLLIRNTPISPRKSRLFARAMRSVRIPPRFIRLPKGLHSQCRIPIQFR